MTESETFEARTSSELEGHEGAERILLESFNTGKLHHGWLITGPRGIGKATLAYRFARFLLKYGQGAGDSASLFESVDLPKDDPESLYVDPEDPIFHRVAAKGHGDLMTVEREFDEKKGRFKGQIGVDRVRKVAPFMSKTSSEGGWRIVIIDAADEMNRNSANALLKVLEEPPEKAVLILIAHNPGQLLPTIKSRCRTLKLSPLEKEVLVKLLRQHFADLSKEDAAQLARLSDGSFGRAANLYQEGGLDLYKDLLSVLGQLPKMDGLALHALSDRMARSGADDAFRTLGDLMGWWLGRVITYGARGPQAQANEDPMEVDLRNRILQNADLNKLIDHWHETTRCFKRAQSGDLDRKQVVLNSFLDLEACLHH